MTPSFEAQAAAWEVYSASRGGVGSERTGYIARVKKLVVSGGDAAVVFSKAGRQFDASPLNGIVAVMAAELRDAGFDRADSERLIGRFTAGVKSYIKARVELAS